MDNNNRIIEQIEKIKQIKRGESLVIFVGAGVSKNSGVCSWGELVKEISDKVGENKCTTCEVRNLICGECGEQIEMCTIDNYNCKLKYDFSAEDYLRIPQHFYESFGTSDITRVLYFFFVGNKAVLTNGFTKKTQKTPKSEIELAEKYKADYERRNHNE